MGEARKAIAFTCECAEDFRTACGGLPFYKEQKGKRYCVLHYPGQEKAGDFAEALKAKLDGQSFDFRGVWFPDELDLREFQFKTEVSFQGATFGGDAHFDGAQFIGFANFEQVTFGHDARFEGAKFSGEPTSELTPSAAEETSRELHLEQIPSSTWPRLPGTCVSSKPHSTAVRASSGPQ